MNEIILSVIIPVYNGAQFIRPCLQSVLHHAEPTVEVLVIDDGSTDATPSICESIGQQDARLRLIRQKNRGVSAARNTGIREARGKYLAFMDADDLFIGNIFILAAEKMPQFDLVCWNHLCLRDGKEIPLPPMELPEDPVAWVIYPNNKAGKYFRSCWGKLFDGQLIRENRIFFDETLHIGEDAVFLLEYLKYTERLCMLPERGYCYRIRPDSAVGRQQPELLQQALLQKAYMDIYAPTHPAAVTGLYWDIFCKLLRNSPKNDDAITWYAAVQEMLYRPGISTPELPRLCSLQYRFGRYLPTSILCTLTRMALGTRRTLSKGGPNHDKNHRRN